jgi:hypothetical protein
MAANVLVVIRKSKQDNTTRHVGQRRVKDGGAKKEHMHLPAPHGLDPCISFMLVMASKQLQQNESSQCRRRRTRLEHTPVPNRDIDHTMVSEVGE